jgi:glycopeptide antibiotics resistance protein
VLFKQIRLLLFHSRWRPSLTLVFLLLWVLFIIYATTLPFDFSASGDLVNSRLRRLVEHPLRGGRITTDVVSNVLLFIPFGFLLAMWRDAHGASLRATLVLAVLSGAFLSGSVEVAQLFAPSRFSSFVDLTTNTFGSMVGAVTGWVWTRQLWPILSVRIRQLLVVRPLTGCALVVAAGLVVGGLAPFDVVIKAADLKVAIKKARPIPFGPPMRGNVPAAQPWLWASELLTWTLAGGLFALAARERGWRGHRALVLALAPAVGLCLVIEAMQVVISSRDADMTSVVLALAGSVLGAAPLVRSKSGDARQWIMPAVLIWTLVVVLKAWSPWRFAWPEPPFWKPEMAVPFWSYYDSRSVADLADVIGQALTFVPLGALLAARSWRQSFFGVVLIGLMLATVLEIGQIFIPGRASDISDVISAAAGSGLGLALWRWGESARTTSMGIARYRIHPRTGLLG